MKDAAIIKTRYLSIILRGLRVKVVRIIPMIATVTIIETNGENFNVTKNSRIAIKI
jgi:hypothetical protein